MRALALALSLLLLAAFLAPLSTGEDFGAVGKVNKLIDIQDTPQLAPGESGRVRFLFNSTYSETILNVRLNASIYRYATIDESIAVDTSWTYPYPRIAETGSRDIHGRHVAPAAGEEDAVASFSAAELEHPGAGREQRAQHPRERGGSRTQDVFVRPPSILERPRAPRRHVSRQRVLAARPPRSTASSASFAGSTGVRLRINFTAAFSSPSTLGSSGSPPRLSPTAARTIPPSR